VGAGAASPRSSRHWCVVLPHAGVSLVVRRGDGRVVVVLFPALQLGNASLVAPVDKTSVVMVLVLSAVVLSEPLTPRTIVGALLIVGGTLVLIWQ
jgi:uncharacterized membrane protein